MRKNILSISILLSGFLISVSILYKFNLDTVEQLFSMVGSFSIVIALSAYFYKKNQDRTVAAIDQISIFRKEIIPEWGNVSKLLKQKNVRYMFSRIKLDQPTIAFMRREYSRNFQDQSAIFLNKFEVNQELWDTKILDSQIKLFNMLEEFSLRVFHFGTDRHQALNAIRAAFIEIIEKNAVSLLFVRHVVVGNPIYSNTLSLYEAWKDYVDRSFIVKRLAKYGFITDKQKEVIFKKIRETSPTETSQFGH